MIFYDCEVFRFDWLIVLNNTNDRTQTVIVNDPDRLQSFYETHKNEIWAGYNSRHYDQYIVKGILCGFDPFEISQHIIEHKKAGWQFSNQFQRIQLYNYDIMTDKTKSLKQLEGFMGASIRETSVPFDIDRPLTESELNEVAQYCSYDVEQAMEVFLHRIEEFESHMSLIKAFKLPLSYIGKTKAQLAAIILDAKKVNRADEFEITLPDTLRIEKYRFVADWYQDWHNRDYEKVLNVDVAGVPHTFAWGGLHGAVPNYHGKGVFLSVDVASYYPALMIEYGFGSRNIADPDKYRQIRDERIRLKAEKNPMQAPYKIVLNSTFGAMKDQYNPLYDPLQANNVCVGGQLLLLDLIEHIEPVCELIQSNTDGLIVKINRPEDLEDVRELCAEWQARTRMVLEFEVYERIIQKDVNNYILVDRKGEYKSKGAYVKKLDALDYDLPIVNKAVVDYFVHGIPVERTINEAVNLIDFQKIVKVSEKYTQAMHGDRVLSEKVLRVFASRSRTDPGIFKVKNERPEKIAGTPERCFIENGDIRGMEIPRKLDRTWYIETARKRIADFLGEEYGQMAIPF